MNDYDELGESQPEIKAETVDVQRMVQEDNDAQMNEPAIVVVEEEQKLFGLIKRHYLTAIIAFIAIILTVASLAHNILYTGSFEAWATRYTPYVDPPPKERPVGPPTLGWNGEIGWNKAKPWADSSPDDGSYNQSNYFNWTWRSRGVAWLVLVISAMVISTGAFILTVMHSRMSLCGAKVATILFFICGFMLMVGNLVVATYKWDTTVIDSCAPLIACNYYWVEYDDMKLDASVPIGVAAAMLFYVCVALSRCYD